jgi:Glycosyltransferase
MKKKILHIQLLPLLSGVQRVSLQEFERIKLDYEIYLICKEPGPLSHEAEKLGVKVIHVESLCRKISILDDFKSLMAIYRVIRDLKFDIVHTHSSKTGLLGRVASKLTKVPLIIHTVHGFPFDSAKNRFSRFIYKAMEIIGGLCSDKIICLHEQDKNICINDLFIHSDKIIVIPNGVNVDRFYPISAESKSQLRQHYGIPQSATVYIMVGRLWKQKNPRCFIDAAIESLETMRNYDNYFLVVGDGELRSELEALCEKNPLYTQRIKFLGWSDNVSGLLGVSDVFVLPSLWEGMPLAILEAQACGLPCLVSNIPGNRDLVLDGVDGYLFNPSKSSELANLMKITENKVLIKELSLNAREKITKHFDVNVRIDLILNIYSSKFN